LPFILPAPRSDTSDATAALQLDGIPFRGNTLKIKRPKDYVPAFGVRPRCRWGLAPAARWAAGLLLVDCRPCAGSFCIEACWGMGE
jgi:hypothetical protein